MAQQTAMQELIKWLECGWKDEDVDTVIKKSKQLIEIEKEQIINAWRNGDNDSMYSPKELDQQAEQYYNETYGK